MRVVVALGGNALLRRGQELTADNQRENARAACRHLAPVAAEHQLVIAHGNGPQVGLLALQAFIGPLNVLLTWALARRLFGPRSALAAAIVVAAGKFDESTIRTRPPGHSIGFCAVSLCANPCGTVPAGDRTTSVRNGPGTWPGKM